MGRDMSIGFVCWNPFQIFHMQSICKHSKNGVILLLKHQDVDYERLFNDQLLSTVDLPYQFIARSDIPVMDGRINALVCPNPIPEMEQLQKTKTVCMQYSMTKERYQYGAWRSLFDLNLVYGEYSRQRVAPWGPTVSVDNSRFDPWFNEALDPERIAAMREMLDPNKPTILYLPTWGEFSSVEKFGPALAEMERNYNVLVKVHHKTDSHELNKIAHRLDLFSHRYLGGDDVQYLFHVADLVMSDYSGAIFDAIYLRKPIMLLQEDASALIGKKFGFESIEYAERENIGPVVSDPRDLKRSTDAFLADPTQYAERNAALREQTFSHEGKSGAIAANAIETFLTSAENQPAYQTYLRDEFRAVRIRAAGKAKR